jgi:hypothetical protein
VDDAVYRLVGLAPRAILLGYTVLWLRTRGRNRRPSACPTRAARVFQRVPVMLVCGLVIFLPARGPQHGAWCRARGTRQRMVASPVSNKSRQAYGGAFWLRPDFTVKNTDAPVT